MSNSGSDAFLTKVQERIEALSRDITALAAQEEGVRRRRGELEQEVADLHRSVKVYGDIMGIGATAASGQPSAVLDAKGSGTIADAIASLLEQHGGRGRVADIVGWMVEIGRLPPGKAARNYAVIYSALQRNSKRFERVGTAEFRLGAGSPVMGADGRSVPLAQTIERERLDEQSLTAAPRSTGLPEPSRP